MKFNEKLYSLRKGAGMTQTELAEKLNVSRQAVSRWEMGTAMPDVDNLIAMSDLFSVTLDDLLKNREDAPEAELPGPEQRAVSYWQCLPKRWWIFPAVSAGARLVSFLWELLVLLFPGSPGTVASGSVSAFFMMWFSIPGLILLSTVFFALTALEFLWALVKWIKARK